MRHRKLLSAKEDKEKKGVKEEEETIQECAIVAAMSEITEER